MSNSRSPVGEIQTEMGSVLVGEWSTSSEHGVELSCQPNELALDNIGDYVGLDANQVRELIHLLQVALGDHEHIEQRDQIAKEVVSV